MILSNDLYQRNIL
jgi:hypothetical protein